MTAHLVTILATCTLAEASQLMAQRAIRHLPVVDEDGRLIGIVSDRDLRGSRLHGADAPAAAATVGDVMVRDVITAAPADELATIAQLMAGGAIGAVPIIDAARRPIGIVSYVDVLRRLVRDEEADRAALARIDGY